MNNLNLIFLEEYKHLDKLCSELYDGELVLPVILTI